MRKIGKWRLTHGLSSDQLNAVVAWFAESYDAGWRPQGWSPVRDGALRNRVAELEDEQRVADGDVPWV